MRVLPDACFACSTFKGHNIWGFDQQTGQLVALFNPRIGQWAHHFRWNGPKLFALTSVGRVTLDVLAINLPYRIQLRQVLMDEGLFPPNPSPSGR